MTASLIGQDPHIVIDVRMARVSGIGTYIEEVVPRVIARCPRARFTLLGDDGLLRSLIEPVARVRYEPLGTPIYSLREQWALRAAIPRDTSLFWAPHYNIPLLHGGPLAVTVHDTFHLVDANLSRLKHAYARVMFRAVIRRARVVLCNSRFTAGELRRHAGEPRKLVVTPLGVSPRWFELREPQQPPPTPYFLAVGNVKPHKNLGRLVQAFARLGPDIRHRLVIVGRREGLIGSDTAVQSHAAGLGTRIEFTGHVDRADLERWMLGCDALVHPSLYEGFGLPPLEALACGRAVAVSDAAALPETCGPLARYFDPLDVDSMTNALRELVARPPDDASIREVRRSWARGLDWDTCARATALALTEAAAGDRGEVLAW